MKKSKQILCIGLVIILVCSLFASLIQNDFGNVKVQHVNIPGANGVSVHGIMYMPKDASAENKTPLIVTCHGWGGNAQENAAWGIELSRRGVTVLTIDAIAHGQSDYAPINTFLDGRTKYGIGMYTAVDYCLSGVLDFVDTERVGLMGHSMGMSAIAATLGRYSPDNYPISAVMAVGNMDKSVQAAFENMPNNVNFGVLLCTHESKKNLEQNTAGTNFVMNMIGVTDYKPDTYYGNAADGTLRVYYEPEATHMLEPFLPNCVADVTEFWEKAFDLNSGLLVTNQVYYIKSILTLIALVAVFAILLPATDLLLAVPCFADLREKVKAKAPALTGARKKRYYLGILLMILASFIACILSFVWYSYGQSTFSKIFPATMVNNSYFMPATRLIPTMVLAAMMAICLAVWYVVSKKMDKAEGIDCTDRAGLSLPVGKVWKSIVLSGVVVGFVYLLVYFVDWAFMTDFRFFKVSLQTFSVDKLFTAIQYIPACLAFYFLQAAFVNGSLRVEGMSEKKNLLIAVIASTAGTLLFFVMQYTGLLIQGRAFTIEGNWVCTCWIVFDLWKCILTPILLRKFYELTGKNWVGPIVVTVIYTLSNVANTAIHCSPL